MNKDRETIIIIRKKKGHGGGHHGGAWKVAFADFMTAMFALFLVLWLVNQSSDVKANIAGYFQDPLGHADEFGSSIAPGDGAQAATSEPISDVKIGDLRKAQMQQLAERIRRRLEQSPEFGELAQHIEITLTREGLQIELREDSTGVFFETGSARPRENALGLLQAIGAELATLPNNVVVDGYTDAAPYHIGAEYSNWELSADRANVARRTMLVGGLHEPQVTQVRGHAERDLRTPADPTAATNRRVTITMLFQAETLVSDTLAARMAATQ